MNLAPAHARAPRSPLKPECSRLALLLSTRRVVVFHLTKWHRLAAGNVRDSSRTWWRKAFNSEEGFDHMVHPHGDYYNQKDK